MSVVIANIVVSALVAAGVYAASVVMKLSARWPGTIFAFVFMIVVTFSSN